MIDDATTARVLQEYPAVSAIEAALRADVLAHEVQWVGAPAGTLLFDEGSPCRGFPMVVSGEVRVARGTPHGRALELYRVQRGELCVASTACIVGARSMQAHGVTTQASELALLSAAGFERWSAAEPFRRFVFSVFAERLSELMALVEAVAFQRLDQRLAAALLSHGAVVHSTHQALAEQLGTAREIVTRLLKRFELAGQVRLSRERIDVIDAPALRALAEPPPAATTPQRSA
jgi:CRP/FNR family transcriptional regulator, anaerobic regulatory protein